MCGLNHVREPAFGNEILVIETKTYLETIGLPLVVHFPYGDKKLNFLLQLHEQLFRNLNSLILRTLNPKPL